MKKPKTIDQLKTFWKNQRKKNHSLVIKAEGVLKSMLAISVENRSFENKMTIKGCKVTIKAGKAYTAVCDENIELLNKGIVSNPNPSVKHASKETGKKTQEIRSSREGTQQTVEAEKTVSLEKA